MVYFEQSTLMLLGRKVCEASLTLAELYEISDQKKLAIKQRRLLKKKKGKPGKPSKKLNALISLSAKQVGETDSESKGSNKDLDVVTGIDPSIGLKGFISQNLEDKSMNEKIRDSKSGRSSTMRRHRTAMRGKLGDEDAVSEKPEDLETSSSGGSNSGSSCQDLSDIEHDAVLSSVLNQLKPRKPGSRLSQMGESTKLIVNIMKKEDEPEFK